MPTLDELSILRVCEGNTESQLSRAEISRQLQALAKATTADDSTAPERFWAVLAEQAAVVVPRLWERVQTTTGVYTADLIPRQASLNVNQIYKNQKRRGIAGAFSSLFGLGVKVGYQRQKETFSQFVHQDSFASGFGKGESEFGWTFGPLPGTQRVAPGVRTTYAVLVVPRDAVALRLVAFGHGYRHRHPPREWNPGQAEMFFIPIPRINQGFFLTDVNYTSVPAGERVMVELEGTYFSPQVGVLINGLPLRRVVSISRPELSPRVGTSAAVDQGQPVRGEFELVNPREIKMAFAMGEDYEGTPIISLVTPQKATPINHFRLRINHRREPRQLSQVSREEPMFLKPLHLDSLSFFATMTEERDCPEPHDEEFAVLHLNGDGFRRNAFITLNGALPEGSHRVLRSSSRYELHIPVESIDWSTNWHVTLSQSNSQGNEVTTESFPNPCVPRIGEPRILHHWPGDRKADPVTELVIPLHGHLAGSRPHVSFPDQEPVACCGTSNCSKSDLQCRQVSTDQLWVRASSPKNPLTLRLSWSPTSSMPSSLVTVIRPEAPTIQKLQKNEGVTTGGETVQVHGRNLGAVTRVRFGDNEATILTREPGVLTVKAPPHGAEGSVQVRLLTDLEYGGRMLTNGKDLVGSAAYYTYKKPK